VIASSLITGARGKGIGEGIALGMVADVALVARTEADLERALAAYPRINILASCAGMQRRMTVTVQAGHSRTHRNGDRVPMP
jgi:short-subunit dehydrogenase involved in D-alanine esterification of teichoic acids